MANALKHIFISLGKCLPTLDIPNYFESSIFRTAMNASYRNAVFRRIFLFNFIHGYFYLSSFIFYYWWGYDGEKFKTTHHGVVFFGFSL
ncbi:hypothetical protein ABNX05_12825 [Lysinibacillus sp. M3]|uniref:DUF418 domain-containing protein n=1 Tax=Lysinibacillus zambalensis TaxID=3160866 RepID=A0ABV1MSM3_9BACI